MGASKRQLAYRRAESHADPGPRRAERELINPALRRPRVLRLQADLSGDALASRGGRSFHRDDGLRSGRSHRERFNGLDRLPPNYRQGYRSSSCPALPKRGGAEALVHQGVAFWREFVSGRARGPRGYTDGTRSGLCRRDRVFRPAAFSTTGRRKRNWSDIRNDTVAFPTANRLIFDVVFSKYGGDHHDQGRLTLTACSRRSCSKSFAEGGDPAKLEEDMPDCFRMARYPERSHGRDVSTRIFTR
jgi:hypothetical protein